MHKYMDKWFFIQSLMTLCRHHFHQNQCRTAGEGTKDKKVIILILHAYNDKGRMEQENGGKIIINRFACDK